MALLPSKLVPSTRKSTLLITTVVVAPAALLDIVKFVIRNVPPPDLLVNVEVVVTLVTKTLSPAVGTTPPTQFALLLNACVPVFVVSQDIFAANRGVATARSRPSKTAGYGVP